MKNFVVLIKSIAILVAGLLINKNLKEDVLAVKTAKYFKKLMNKKIAISILLLGIITLAGCSNQTNNQNSENNTSDNMNSEIVKADRIEVIDFHGTRRCYSCETIEKYTKETLEEFFQKEIKEKKIIFQSINNELQENQVIVQKYQARGSSLFINAVRNGQDNISEDTQVWRLVGDEKKFKEYLKNKINNLLK